ncbi:MAG: c-type cytochrome, partial [Xanthomonadales bacterium]
MKRSFALVIIALALGACSREESQNPEPYVVDIANGERLVEAQCTGCHAPDGSGRTAEIPNLAGQPARYLESAMLAYRSGERHHAGLQDLFQRASLADLRDVAAYYASLPPVQSDSGAAGIAPEAIYAEGRQMAAACLACHGDHGFSTTPGIPNLAGQHPMYLIVATQEYANGTRNNAEKEAMLQGLDNVD